jgi:hexokinase
VQLCAELAVPPERAAAIRDDFLKQMRMRLNNSAAAQAARAAQGGAVEETSTTSGESNATAAVTASLGAADPFKASSKGGLASSDTAQPRGQKGAASSSLLMLPSWLSALPSGHETGAVLAIDFGGTSFRVMHVVLAPGKGEVVRATLDSQHLVTNTCVLDSCVVQSYEAVWFDASLTFITCVTCSSQILRIVWVLWPMW